MKYDVTFHPSWWHKKLGIDFSQDFFDDPKYRIESDVKMRRFLYDCFGDYGIGEADPKLRPLLGSDLLACGYLYSEIMGCDIKYQKYSSPEVVCAHLLPEECAKICVPDLDQNPVWNRMQKQIDFLTEKYGYCMPMINLMGVQNIALDLMGDELLTGYYEDEESVRRVLEIITDLCIQIGKRLKKCGNVLSGGVTAIIEKTVPEAYVTSNCSVDFIAPVTYEEFLLEYDRRLATEFSPFGVHHCGGHMERYAALYMQIPNLEFAEVGAGSDVTAVCQAMPGLFLNIRFSPVELKSLSKHEISKKVEMLCNSCTNPFSMSCVGIDAETPDESICALLEAMNIQGK